MEVHQDGFDQQPAAELNDVPEAALATYAAHEDRLVLKELHVSLGRPPAVQRETLFMVVLHGMSHEQVAEATGCAAGTAKSRVFRARQQLQPWLAGETPSAAGRPQPWSVRTGDKPAHALPAAALTAGEACGTGRRHGTPHPRQAGLIQIAGDAAC